MVAGMSHDARQQIEAAARHIFEGREPCEYDYMRVVPSWHRTPPLPGRCRICGLPVGPGRRSTCGPECAATTQQLVFWSSMCYAAWERDGGLCRDCGKDLGSLNLDGVRVPYFDPTYHHVVEVNEGGGQLGLDNIMTLCEPCHAAKTAEYAARRAAAKRQETRQASPQLSMEVPS
jgi:hypothetical protein